MSAFTLAYVAWNEARHNAGLPEHKRYTAGRAADIDLSSAIAELTPLLLNSAALTDAALCDVIKLADTDELTALAAAVGRTSFANCLEE